MKKAKLFYCIVFFGICLIPSVGTLVTKPETSTENRELAEFPSLCTEDGWNINWLSEAGDYFQEHFALRSKLVTANACIYGKGLETSTASGVIQGTDGWLYYKDSLADYQGTGLMSERSLFNLSHTLMMTQKYVEAQGTKFVFAAAPNKNSLYDENMPYYYKCRASDEKNLENLTGWLEKEGVSNVNLYDLFETQDEVLYHKRDSHWNNKGAALAAQQLLDAVGKGHKDWSSAEYMVRRDFEGDLDQMLYPQAMTPEDEIYYDEPFTYTYTEKIESTFAPRIYTENSEKSGSLIVYRDSFGNALLPFLAEEYGKAYFSRGIPYQLSDIKAQGADTVIVERAERFLPDMAQDPPVMPAPKISWDGKALETATDGAADIMLTEQGGYACITGRVLSEYLDTETRICVQVNGGSLYEASPTDIALEDGTVDSGGFTLYIPKDKVTGEQAEIEVFCITDGQIEKIYSGRMEG